MPDNRKPPIQDPTRREMRMPADSGGFSIESTTLRLRAVRLQRMESEKKHAIEQRASRRQPASKSDDSGERERPSGRVRHDERGRAVWDWAVATGEFATLSTTVALKKLEIAELEVQDSKPAELALEVSGRDVGGGGDPYNQRGNGRRPDAAAVRQGVTGSDTERQRKAQALQQLLGRKR